MSEISVPASSKYFLRLKEAAAILGVSERWLRSVVNGERGSNKPHVVRMGDGYRLPTREFMDWVNAQTERWPAPKKRKKRCT